MTANPTECSFDICSEDSQPTLHDENGTTVRFSTTINGIPCQAHVLCKPCRPQHSHLTAHDCEIRYTIPPSVSIEAANQWKHLIAAEARRLCPKHSNIHAGAALQAGVGVSRQSDPFTNNRAKHQLTSIEEPPNKYRKFLQANRVHADPSAETAENFNHDAQNLHPLTTPKRDVVLTWNSIDAVQESYRSAIRTGQLKYAREPQLPSGSPKVRLWDPYIITPESVRHALLDDEKMDMITKSVESTIKIVPKADEWPAKARKRSLTPEDVRRILLTAFAEPSLKQEPEQDDKLPRPQKIIAEVLRRAEGLKKRRACREAAVLRMTAYALMEVAVVAGEATEIELPALFGHAKKWVNQSRYFVRSWSWAMANLPWSKGLDLPLFFMFMDEHGEPTLRTFFQPTVPAIAGEFVSALSSEEYWRNLPATRSPGLIEVVMVLLDGCVNHETICFALGCSVSYQESLDPNLFAEVCTQGATFYQSKLFWEEAAGETGQEDQTKKDDGLSVGVNDDSRIPNDYDSGKDFEALFCGNFDVIDFPP